MITLSSINKTFRVAKRQAGFGRAVKAMLSFELACEGTNQQDHERLFSGIMNGFQPIV